MVKTHAIERGSGEGAPGAKGEGRSKATIELDESSATTSVTNTKPEQIGASPSPWRMGCFQRPAIECSGTNTTSSAASTIKALDIATKRGRAKTNPRGMGRFQRPPVDYPSQPLKNNPFARSERNSALIYGTFYPAILGFFQ